MTEPIQPFAKRPATKRFLKAVSGQITDRPPFWFMRQAGRYLPEYRAARAKAGSFLDLCFNPELAEEVTLQPIRRFGMDAAILFSDILVVPYALGQNLRFAEGEGPLLSPVADAALLANLGFDAFHERLSPVYETVRRLKVGLPPEVALIGFAGSPWTVATYMVAGRGTSDQAPAKDWAFRDADGFQRLIDLLVEATTAYLVHQVEAGAEAIQLFDTWAGSLSAASFERWCIAPTAVIVQKLKARFPDLPVIGFPRHAGVLYQAYAERTGVDAVSLDPTVPPVWAASALQTRVAVQGNLDPRLVVAGGAAMTEEARGIVEALRGGPFIFNLGHGFVPETPVEHVAALSNFIKGLAR